MDPKRIDEPSRRRPEFAGDVPVVLCDGQTWHLPKPRIRFRPRTGPNGFEAKPTCQWGDEFWSKIDALATARESDDVSLLIDKQMDLCCSLVLKNYDLAEEDLGELLQFEFGDPDNDAMRDVILRVAQGLPPKTSGDGSAAS